MMKKISFLFLIFSLLIACNKDDEPSPEDWTVDDNIFRCKVNGEEWEPEGDGVSLAGGNLDIYYENFFNNAIQINASKKTNNINQAITLFIFVDDKVVGEYNNTDEIVFLDFDCGNYFQDSLATNTVIISEIDSLNNIISGSFEFTGQSSDCATNIVVATDGYFKAKYRN